jgi:acyl-CoA thioester hydrolase
VHRHRTAGDVHAHAMRSASEPPPLFRLRLRIYWEDTDAGGVVFYANYLKFFERARTEWLRSRGVEQEVLRHTTGLVFVVADTALRYRSPARLDDLIDVTVAVAHAGQASMQFAQQAWRGDLLLAEGSIRVGCVDAGTFRPCRIPNDVLLAMRTPTSPPLPDLDPTR